MIHGMGLSAILGLAMQATGQECANPPSRASDSYWSHIETCGCAKLDPPSRASQDHDRFWAACSQWRQRNPEITVTVQGASVPSPSPSTPGCVNPPSRASDFYWAYIDTCGCAQLTAPSAASPDHERFLKACSEWRERNPRINVIASPSPRPSPSGRPRAAPSPIA